MAGRIDQINNINGFPPLVKNVPPNYPTRPTPDKISLLFQYNENEIYHKYSPYTSGDNVFGIFPNKQPFVYKYIDTFQDSTFNQLPVFVKTLATATNIPRVIDDTVRVSKFLISPQGIIYNLKQFSIQRLNVFDETRMYNPLTPILATIQPATLGIGMRPVRHIEGGVFGLLNSITSTVGINFQSGFQTPSSTVGPLALPSSNTGQGKGLIRGGTASSGMLLLNNKWATKTNGLLGLKGLFESVKQTFKTYFGGSPKSDGEFRADEKSYEMMRVSQGKLDSYDKDSKTIIPLSVKYHPSFPYLPVIPELEAKLVDYADSKDDTYPTNFNSNTSTPSQIVEENLKSVIASLQKNTLYQTATNTYSKLLSSGNSDTLGYDYKVRNIPSNRSIPKSDYGVTLEYANTFGTPKTIDRSTSWNNVRMATTFTSDALNSIGVLGQDKKLSPLKQYPNYTEYKPYEDDLVAFFFYDVVNQKYIPFRATMKGISEGNTAFWDELRFIGRADQLYSYNGFSRTLSFTFNVVISSIIELLPTWQKINYMASCVKPSNYTAGSQTWQNGSIQGDNRFSRFIVPPMFMITIGDLYKFQPVVVTSVNVNIPDDAVWETLNEENAPRGWSYLNGIITSPSVEMNYAQLPREVEIAVTCNLLEKERAIVGGSHFGHAPRKDDWESLTGNDRFLVGNDSFLPKITKFNENEVVFNLAASPTLTQPTQPFGTLLSSPSTLPSTPSMERLADQKIMSNLKTVPNTLTHPPANVLQQKPPVINIPLVNNSNSLTNNVAPIFR